MAVWLLDVDGVVNMFPSLDTPPKDRWTDVVETTVSDGANNWPISYSPGLVAGIRSVVERGLAEVRWLTTWEDAAHGLAEALGLPKAVVAGYEAKAEVTPAGSGRPRWWKHWYAERLADEADRLVWTDDELQRYRDAWEWTQSRDNVFAPVIKPTVGISPRQLGDIETWLTSRR